MANSAVTPTAFYTTLGRTDGAAVPAGYVGETITGSRAVTSQIALTSNTWTNITSITVTAGVWMITGFAGMGQTTSTTLNDYGYAVSKNNAAGPTAGVACQGVPVSGEKSEYVNRSTTLNTANQTTGSSVSPYVFVTNTTTTLYLNIIPNFTGGISGQGFLQAVRIA